MTKSKQKSLRGEKPSRTPLWLRRVIRWFLPLKIPGRLGLYEGSRGYCHCPKGNYFDMVDHRNHTGDSHAVEVTANTCEKVKDFVEDCSKSTLFVETGDIIGKNIFNTKNL